VDYYYFFKFLNVKNEFSRKEDSSVPIGWSLRFLRSLHPLRRYVPSVPYVSSIRTFLTFVALAGNPAEAITNVHILPSEDRIQIVDNLVFLIVDFVASTADYKVRIRQSIEIHRM